MAVQLCLDALADRVDNRIGRIDGDARSHFDLEIDVDRIGTNTFSSWTDNSHNPLGILEALLCNE
jgi:hypothetical protein